MSSKIEDLVGGIKRRPFLSVCGALVVALALVLYFRAGRPAELRARLDEREKEFSRLNNNVKFSAQLDTQLTALREANALIEAGALRPGELAGNQRLFLRLEAESGAKLVDLRQLAVSPPASAPAKAPAKGATAPVAGVYASIPFSVTIQGEYPQLMDFLKRLEHGPTLSRLTSAQISQPAEGGRSISITAELLGFRS